VVVVQGHILDGPKRRMVVLRFRRLPHSLESVASAFLAGALALVLARDFFHPIFGAVTAVAAIVAGMVLPHFGAVPSRLVHAVSWQLAQALLGEIE
jgi:hypothetical protein